MPPMSGKRKGQLSPEARRIRKLIYEGKASKVVIYHDGADAALAAAGIPRTTPSGVVYD